MNESASLSASPVIVENVTKRFRQGNTIVDALQDIVGNAPAAAEGN